MKLEIKSEVFNGEEVFCIYVNGDYIRLKSNLEDAKKEAVLIKKAYAPVRPPELVYSEDF